MDKNKIHIIPELDKINEYITFCNTNGFHFEYNDFFIPNELDNKELIQSKINSYREHKELPVNNSLHGSFLDVTLFSSDKTIRAHSEFRIRESMEIAEKLSVNAVVIHTNIIPNYNDEHYTNNWLKLNSEFIRQILNEFKSISIYMENMFDMNPKMLAAIGKELQDETRFGICFDYAHAHVFGTSPIEDWINSLSPYIKHIHINDNNLLNDQHLSLGEGKIDYRKFFEYYDKYFNNSTILLEMKGMDKIKKSVEYLKMIKAIS